MPLLLSSPAPLMLPEIARVADAAGVDAERTAAEVEVGSDRVAVEPDWTMVFAAAVTWSDPPPALIEYAAPVFVKLMLPTTSAP